MALEPGPFGYQIGHEKYRGSHSPSVGQSVHPPRNDSAVSIRELSRHTHVNSSVLRNGSQAYAIPAQSTTRNNGMCDKSSFKQLDKAPETVMVSADELWEQVDSTLALHLPENTLAAFASHRISDKPPFVSKESQRSMPLKVPGFVRRSAQDSKRVYQNDNDTPKNKFSLAIRIPQSDEFYTDDVAFEEGIEEFHGDNRTSSRQAACEMGTPAFKDSGVYMEDGFHREASKESATSNDQMDEAYHEGNIPGPHAEISGSSSPEDYRDHIASEHQDLPWGKTIQGPPTFNDIMQTLTPEEYTVHSSLAVFDRSNEPYIRGGTPPYDTMDLNSRCESESPIWIGSDISLDMRAIYRGEEIETNAYEMTANQGPGTENEASVRSTSSNAPLSQPMTGSMSAGEGQNPPESIDSPAALLNMFTLAIRQFSPPTPHWPSTPALIDREPTPATPRWPMTPDNYGDGAGRIDSTPASADETLRAHDQESPSGMLPGINRTAFMTTQDKDTYSEGKSSVSQTKPRTAGTSQENTTNPEPMSTTSKAIQSYQALSNTATENLSSPTPAPRYPLATPEQWRFLDELTDSSTDSDAGGDPTLPANLMPLYASWPPTRRSPSFLSSPAGTPVCRNPTKWINIVPPVQACSSSPNTDSSGFVDNGITASFHAPSPTLRDVKNTSPTGITQLRLSRQNYRESEDRMIRAASVGRQGHSQDQSVNLETPQSTYEYPEHPSFRSSTVNVNKGPVLDAGRPLNDYDGIIPGTQDSNTPNAGNLTSSPPPSDNQGLATQNAARPVLNRESSSFDSLQTFPPTPTDGVPPPFLLASTTFANPNSNFMAAQRTLATSVRHPSTPPVSENATQMPRHPRLSPSTSALELRMPTEVAGTPTPARRGRGRPRKADARSGPKRTPARKAPMQSTITRDETPTGEEIGARKAPRKSTVARDQRPPGKRGGEEQEGGSSGKKQRL